MKLVVTGALGHIGSRLIRELPSSFPDAQIVMLDNLATQRYCSLFSLPAHGRYRFIEGDVTLSDLIPIFEGADGVIHLAAMADPAESFRARDLIERVNVGGTDRVAQACLKTGSPLVFISTTSVYGRSSGTVEEEGPPSDLQPQTPYALSKLKAEGCLQELGQSKGLRFVILRFATVFGVSPGMRFATAVNKFCWQAVMGKPLSVWRTALNQSRPYLELGDAVCAIQFILKGNLFNGRVYNVLTTHATVGHIIDILSSLLPDVAVEFVDQEGMNLFCHEVSNHRLTSLGFQFQGSLRDGIREITQLLQSARSGLFREDLRIKSQARVH